MTEQEAKKKWCPFAIAHRAGISGGGNRVQYEGGDWEIARGTTCIASGCMAWRSQYEWNPDASTIEPVGGYCGLAGRS